MQFFSTIASLIACVSAYQVLTPTANSTIAKGSTVNVKFSTVDTDASTFSVYLVNFATAHWPPTVLSLAQDVSQSAGSVNVRIPCSVSSDSGYQLNFINGTNTYVIYAQSAAFSLTGDCVDPTPSNPAGTYTNGTTVYQTIVYENPVVWFVQPSNVIAAAAICPPSSQQTVTVQQAAAAPVTVTKTVTSCPSQAAILAALASAQGAGAAAAAVAPASASVSARSSVSGSSGATAAALPTKSAVPVSTGSAGKAAASFIGLTAVFVAMLL